MDERDSLRAERDMYRRLVHLNRVEDPTAFLSQVLQLATDAAGAQHGYVQLGRDAPVVALASGVQDVDAVRAALSSGVLAEAIAAGRVVASDNASTDPALRDRQSVQVRRIEAVLCAPIGSPALGVLYLQGRVGGGPFSDRVPGLVADLVEALEPLAARILAAAEAGADPTRPWRDKLEGTDGLIGRSPGLAAVLRDVHLYAPLTKTVLALGPSGVGKTALMQLVHANSDRRAGPFVVMDGPSLMPELASAELFGSVRGAYTHASNRAGGVMEAHRGTLFLDEVGELDPTVQAQLLRFLQSGEFRRVGDSATHSADVRVLAATNRDLEQMVADGRFREDLYYRLAQLVIRVPSLAERPEDVLLLAEHQLARFCAEQRWSPLALTPGARRALRDADWSTGGVRRLLHLVDQAAIRAHAEGVPVGGRHLFPDAKPDDAEAGPLTWHDATRQFQRELLERTLAECDGNVSEAARRLDIDRSYVHRLLK